jgi:RimJ/RimL family protein N-acetyltransferase
MPSARPSIRLRPYTDADRWLTEAIELDDEMMAELGGTLPAAAIPQVHARRLEGMASDRLWYFAVELLPDGPAVGTICLWSDLADSGLRSEAGWATLREFQGRGIATEALRLLLERARDDGRWGDIHAFPGATNGPSNALCRAAGFTELGEETVSYAGRQLRCNHWVLEQPGPRDHGAGHP